MKIRIGIKRPGIFGNAGVFVVKVPSIVKESDVIEARKAIRNALYLILPNGWEFVLEVRK